MIPPDSDRDAIRRVLLNGSDPKRPMKIDLYVAVPSETAGRQVAAAAQWQRYETDVRHDFATGQWTCSCSRTMLLDYDALRQCQAELNELSAPFGGRSDGWGTFGNSTRT